MSDVDYDRPDPALKDATLATAQTFDGFTTTEDWQDAFTRRFEQAPAKSGGNLDLGLWCGCLAPTPPFPACGGGFNPVAAAMRAPQRTVRRRPPPPQAGEGWGGG